MTFIVKVNGASGRGKAAPAELAPSDFYFFSL
jgi:hypothetical protein